MVHYCRSKWQCQTETLCLKIQKNEKLHNKILCEEGWKDGWTEGISTAKKSSNSTLLEKKILKLPKQRGLM